MSVPEPCEYLSWDSQFFAGRVARVRSSRLDRLELRRISRWCRDHEIDCVYFLADSDDVVTTQTAEESSFRLVDIRVTLARALDDFRVMDDRVGDEAVIVRPAAQADVPVLRDIAAVSHRASRFYYDNHFAQERCDELYATWIERSCDGYADHVLVAETLGRLAGYITCRKVDRQEGQIGLFGVDRGLRGQGIGTLLVNSSLRWFRDEGLKGASVVTQGRSIGAQRLYQRCGFLTRSVHLWYHGWF